MLIRRPVAEVFDAFVNRAKIKKFWLTDTTGPLAHDARVRWTFMVPGATDDVHVKAFEKDRHIAFNWSDAISVNMDFDSHGENSTTIRLTAEGFTDENATEAAISATEGFTIVLCDLKTLLETGTSAGLVKDKAALLAASK